MAMQIMDCTPEILDEVIAAIKGEPQKEAARQIARRFMDTGLTVKRKCYQAVQMQGVYRLLCFIKKNKEAVILSTDDFGFNGMSVQVRIQNPESLSRLDVLSENIRNQIVNGNGCGFCSTKCEGKRYQFAYNGTDYTKCHMLCSNFRFQVANPDDVDSVAALVEQEIAYAANKNKK